MSSSDRSARAVSVPTGRFLRLARMGAMTAGVAGNMAVNGLSQLGRGHQPRPRDLLLTPANMRRVADELARMRGAAMKVGQLMSMDTGDVLPPELADILARLRADADFMPPRQLKQVLNDQLGTGWLRSFASFDVRPIAAASIGQVHRARLRDGRDLAIKVQYPGIAKSIDSDVANVGRLIRLAGLFPPGFDPAPYLDEARRQLHEEADYEQEARYLQKTRALLSDDPSFALPELVAELSTTRVLTMSFVAGDPIETVDELAPALRDNVATRLIELMLRELFSFALMQTDPNFANYRYDRVTDRIALLDFGASRHLPPALVAQYRRMFQAGMQDNADALEAAALEIGLVSDDMPDGHRSQILSMIRLVFEAISTPQFDFADTDLSRQLQARGEALAEDGLQPPPLPMDVLYIQRKFAGMFLLCARLRAKVPVRDLVEATLSP